MRQVLPVVGAAIGAYFGNGEGAQIGWAIGSVVGNAVDPLVIKGPSIGDIAQQTSQEGVPRPIVFALSQPISGNIVACGLPVIVTKTSSQGKGGPETTSQSVYRTYAIAMCEGPITEVVRAWNNGKLVYDIRPGQPDSGNAAFLQNADIFLGDFDQMPSAQLEAKFGVGNVPAMRGTAYIAWHDIDLTSVGGAVPQYIFQVMRCEGELLTSQPYPLESTEGISGVSTLVSGNGFKAPLDAISAIGGIVSGRLDPVVQTYNPIAEDAILGAGNITAGTIAMVVVSYAGPAEDAIIGAGNITSGTIALVVQSYNPIAEDAIIGAGHIISGTLT